MFFILSKLFWIVFAPSHVPFVLAAAAIVLALLHRERLARQVVIALFGYLFVVGGLPIGALALRPLENRYPRPAWPAHVDGILVLGGGLDVPTLMSRGVVGRPAAEPRLIGAFELARRYPDARLIFSGGSGEVVPDAADAVGAKYIFAQVGLAPARLELESKSRNTWENLAFSRAIARPREGQVWVLATSASHLPRAMGVAARLHWKMVPWPTDYATQRSGLPGFLDLPQNLELADMAFHEWIGLAGYRLSGKTA